MSESLAETQITIRPFRAEDLPQVRKIFCATAYNGHPSINFFEDGAWLAEAMLSYYIRFEPECCLVAEMAGQVVGYLTGAKDISAFQRTWLKKVLPRLVFLFFRQGVCLQSRAWWFLFYGLRSLLRDELDYPPGLTNQFPAHFHVNVRFSVQGHGVGRKLVSSFLDILKATNVRGVHARTSRPDNSHPFFEKLGFTFICTQTLTLWDYLETRPYNLITYVFALSQDHQPSAGFNHA